MKIYIKSKKHGVVEVVYDDIDHEAVSKYKWHVIGNSGYQHTLYAAGHIYKNGVRTVTTMHRVIMGDHIKCIDHIDRNGLNNHRSNLREATTKLNRLNSRLNSNNKSGHRNITTDQKGYYVVNIPRKMGNAKRSFYIGAYKLLSDAILNRDYFLKSVDEEPIFCNQCLNANMGFTHMRGYNMSPYQISRVVN